MSSIERLHKNLISEFAKENKNHKLIREFIQQLEVELNSSNATTLKPDVSDLIHKDFFEISTLSALMANDLAFFEAQATKAVCFYDSLTNDKLSNNKLLIVGLYLMHLLSCNRLTKFHMLLEQIDHSVQQTNPYIRTALDFEQFIAEGAYNKIVLNRMTLPHPLYTGFVQSLMDTMRSEVALCLETSHKRMSVRDAAAALIFEGENDALAFGKQRGWKVEKNTFVFDSLMECDTCGGMDARHIIAMNIHYAKQLEMII